MLKVSYDFHMISKFGKKIRNLYFKSLVYKCRNSSNQNTKDQVSYIAKLFFNELVNFFGLLNDIIFEISCHMTCLYVTSVICYFSLTSSILPAFVMYRPRGEKT